VIGVLEADGTRRVITVGYLPFDRRTLFEIGSITKVFTGILLAEMAERGEVRLEQPVVELLPAGVAIPSRNGRQIRAGGSRDAFVRSAENARQLPAGELRQSLRRLHCRTT